MDLVANAPFNLGNLLFFPAEFPLLRSWIYNVFEFGWPIVLALRMADRAVDDGAAPGLAGDLQIEVGPGEGR